MHVLAGDVVLGRQKEIIILFQLSEVIFGHWATRLNHFSVQCGCRETKTLGSSVLQLIFPLAFSTQVLGINSSGQTILKEPER